MEIELSRYDMLDRHEYIMHDSTSELYSGFVLVKRCFLVSDLLLYLLVKSFMTSLMRKLNL